MSLEDTTGIDIRSIFKTHADLVSPRKYQDGDRVSPIGFGAIYIGRILSGYSIPNANTASGVPVIFNKADWYYTIEWSNGWDTCDWLSGY